MPQTMLPLNDTYIGRCCNSGEAPFSLLGRVTRDSLNNTDLFREGCRFVCKWYLELFYWQETTHRHSSSRYDLPSQRSSFILNDQPMKEKFSDQLVSIKNSSRTANPYGDVLQGVKIQIPVFSFIPDEPSDPIHLQENYQMETDPVIKTAEGLGQMLASGQQMAWIPEH